MKGSYLSCIEYVCLSIWRWNLQDGVMWEFHKKVMKKQWYREIKILDITRFFIATFLQFIIACIPLPQKSPFANKGLQILLVMYCNTCVWLLAICLHTLCLSQLNAQVNLSCEFNQYIVISTEWILCDMNVNYRIVACIIIRKKWINWSP